MAWGFLTPPPVVPLGSVYLVGAPGVGARSTSSPVTGVYSQPPKQGNLLVAVITWGTATAAVPVTAQNAGTSGWSQLLTQGNAGSGSSGCALSIWTKTAAGGDAAPQFTFSGSGGGAGQCTIFELSSPNGMPIDVSAVTGTGVSSSSVTSAVASISTGAPVSAAGEFVIRGYSSQVTVAATNTWTAGAGFRNAYNDAATSAIIHTAVDYAGPTAASGVVTDAPAITTFTGWQASAIVAFRPGPATGYPPGVISAVGQLVANNAPGLTTLAVTPQNTGDVLVVGTKITSGTITVAGISAPGTAGWTRVAGPFVDTAGTVRSHEIWIGTVTAPGATTLTFTWSASNSGLATDLDCQEFTYGYPATWARDGTQQASQNNAASATISWASLTAAASGELWVGTSRVAGGGPYTTSAAGLVCALDTNSNAFCYNVSVSAGAYSPTITDLAGSIASNTLAVLLTARVDASVTTAVVACPSTIGATPVMPKMATLIDSFATNDLATMWAPSTGTIAWSVGQAALQCDTSYSTTLTATGTYDLTGSALYVKMAPYLAASAEAYVLIYKVGANPNTDRFAFGYSTNGSFLNYTIGSSSTFPFSVTYDPVNHAWYRIRESGGTIFLDAAPDGLTWTNLFSIASATLGFPMTLVNVGVQTGDYGADPTGTSYIRGVNAVNALVTSPAVTCASTISAYGPKITNVVAATAAFGADVIRADQQLTTAVVSCPVTVPASTVNAGSAKTTSVVACTTSIPVPSITAQSNATVTPAVVSCPATISATASVSATAVPAVVSCPASFGVPVVIVPASMLTDDFPGSSLDSTKWNVAFGSPSVSGGVLNVPVSTGSNSAVSSVARYSLTGSAAYVQISPGTQQIQLAVQFMLGTLKWFVGNTLIYAEWGAGGTLLGQTTYLPASHQWFRIRESGGTVFFDVSAAGTSWTNMWSVTVATLAAGGVNIDNLQAQLGTITTGTITPATPTFDSYNSAPANATATPAVVAATASFGTQAIRADQIVTPTVVAATAAVPGPVVNAGSQVTPAVVAVPVSVPVPSLHTAEVVTTAVVAAAASVGTPALRTDTILTTAVVACAAAIPVPSLRDDEGLTTAVVPVTASIPVPSVRADQVVITTVAACTSTVPAPVVRAGSGVTTAVVACPVSIAVAVSASETVTTAVVACAATIPAPSILAGGNATAVPTVVGCAATISSPALRADQIASPAVVPASATAAATASAGSTVTAGPVAAVASVPAPSVQSGNNAIVTPAVVSCPAAIGAAVSAGSTASPGVVAALASFGAPVIATATVAVPLVVSVPVTIPAPSLRCDERITAPAVPAVTVITASVVASATVTPGVVSATTAIAVPAAAGGAGASPATLLASALIGTPAVTTGSRIVPPPVACTTAIPVPLIATVATIFLNVVSCRAQIFVPYVTTSRSGGTATAANTTGPEVALARQAASASTGSHATGLRPSRSAADVTVQNRPGAGRVVPGRKP
jgi:hypothetical protein